MHEIDWKKYTRQLIISVSTFISNKMPLNSLKILKSFDPSLEEGCHPQKDCLPQCPCQTWLWARTKNSVESETHTVCVCVCVCVCERERERGGGNSQSEGRGRERQCGGWDASSIYLITYHKNTYEIIKSIILFLQFRQWALKKFNN